MMLNLKKPEDPSDLSHDTIKRLFDEQMIKLTMKTANPKPRTIAEKMRSFDFQFSDAWL